LVALTTAQEWESDRGLALMSILKQEVPASLTRSKKAVTQTLAEHMSTMLAKPEPIDPKALLKAHPLASKISQETHEAWARTQFEGTSGNDLRRVASMYEALRDTMGDAIPSTSPEKPS
jgi:hypothetical protein